MTDEKKPDMPAEAKLPKEGEDEEKKKADSIEKRLNDVEKSVAGIEKNVKDILTAVSKQEDEEDKKPSEEEEKKKEGEEDKKPMDEEEKKKEEGEPKPGEGAQKLPKAEAGETDETATAEGDKVQLVEKQVNDIVNKKVGEILKSYGIEKAGRAPRTGHEIAKRREEKKIDMAMDLLNKSKKGEITVADFNRSVKNFVSKNYSDALGQWDELRKSQREDLKKEVA